MPKIFDYQDGFNLQPEDFFVVSRGGRTYRLSGASLLAMINAGGGGVTPDPLTITGTPGAGVVGTAYTFTPTVAGGSGVRTFSLNGTLPAGLSLDTSTGAVTGTPTAAGSYNFTINVADTGGNTASLGVALSVTSAGVALTISGALPNGTVGSAFSFTPSVAGGTGNRSFAYTGTLPAGTTFDTGTGTVAGTPTTAATYSNINITVTDSGTPPQSATLSGLFTTIAANVTPLSIAGTPPNATQGSPYSFVPTVTGGSGTKSFMQTGTLPAGLAFSTTTGEINGTPTATGTASGIGITVSDSSGTASLSGLSITVGTLPQIGPNSATFTSGAAAGSTITELTNVPNGVTPTFTPNNSADANKITTAGTGSGAKLVVGLTQAFAGTIAGVVSATGASPVNITITVNAAAGTFSQQVMSIANPNSAAVSNHQAPIYVTKQSNMRSDYADLRFELPDGTSLPYWRAYSDATGALCFVKIPAIIANGSQDVRVKWAAYTTDVSTTSAMEAAYPFLTFSSVSGGQKRIPDSANWTEGTTKFQGVSNEGLLMQMGIMRVEAPVAVPAGTNSPGTMQSIACDGTYFYCLQEGPDGVDANCTVTTLTGALVQSFPNSVAPHGSNASLRGDRAGSIISSAGGDATVLASYETKFDLAASPKTATILRKWNMAGNDTNGVNIALGSATYFGPVDSTSHYQLWTGSGSSAKCALVRCYDDGTFTYIKYWTLGLSQDFRSQGVMLGPDGNLWFAADNLGIATTAAASSFIMRFSFGATTAGANPYQTGSLALVDRMLQPVGKELEGICQSPAGALYTGDVNNQIYRFTVEPRIALRASSAVTAVNQRIGFKTVATYSGPLVLGFYMRAIGQRGGFSLNLDDAPTAGQQPLIANTTIEFARKTGASNVAQLRTKNGSAATANTADATVTMESLARYEMKVNPGVRVDALKDGTSIANITTDVPSMTGAVLAIGLDSYGGGAGNIMDAYAGWARKYAALELGVTSGATTLGPQPTTAPSISGTGAIGSQLTGTAGTYSGSPTLTYQWTADNAPISGATSLNYTPVTGMEGKALRLVEYATTANGTTATTSNAISVSTAAIFLNDTFTDPAGTAITAHTPEMGGAWAVQSGYTPTAGPVQTDASGRMWTASGAGGYNNAATPTSANYYVEAVLVKVTTLSGDYVGIGARMQTGANTMYYARWMETEQQWGLYKLISGTATNLGLTSDTFAVGASKTLRLEVNGSSIRVLVDGVQVISATDADITAAGRAGVRMTKTQTSTTGVHMDSIKAATL